MAALKSVNIAEQIKKYPYFMIWLQEVGRSPEDVIDFAIHADIREIEPEGNYKRFEQTDTYTASMNFKDGVYVERHEKWSERKMIYAPTEVN